MKTQMTIALIFAALCQISHAAPKAVAWSSKVDTTVLRKMRSMDRSKEEKKVLKALIKKGHCISLNPLRLLTNDVSQCETVKLAMLLNESQRCKSMLAAEISDTQSGEVDYKAVSEYAKNLGYDFPKSPSNPALAEKEFREYCSSAAKLLAEAAYY